MQLDHQEHRHREGQARERDAYRRVCDIHGVAPRVEPAAAARAPGRPPPPLAAPWPRPAFYAGLFAIAFVVCGFTLLRYVNPFDEGLMLQAARRVSEGQLPYRDFLWVYGPGQPLLLGGLASLLGASLLWWRILRVAQNAAMAAAVYALVRREAPRAWAVLAFVGAACAMAQPSDPNPFPVALLLALLALVLITGPRALSLRIVIAAGALCGLAAAWRLDFAVWGTGALLAAVLVDPRSAGERVRLAAGCVAGAGAVAVLAYLPFLIAAGPSDVADQLVGLTARRRTNVPFPFFYEGAIRAGSPRQLLSDLKDALEYQVPLVSVAGYGLTLLVSAARFQRERRVPPAWAGLLVLGAGALLYLLSRADDLHAQPLAVVLCALLPLCLAWLAGSTRDSMWGRPVLSPWASRPLAALAALGFALLLAAGVANRASALLFPRELVALNLPVADGVKVAPAQAHPLERTVRLVQSRVPPGGATYVATLRSDHVRIDNPLLYVLAERDNVYDKDFGDLGGRRSQDEIVAALRRRRPGAVVRWTNPTTAKDEPNAGGRSTGVRTLDRYLAARYRLLERNGFYEVLVPR